MVNLRLGGFVLFSGIRDWSEIYRYVMILARFEVGINTALRSVTMKLRVFLNLSVIIQK